MSEKHNILFDIDTDVDGNDDDDDDGDDGWLPIIMMMIYIFDVKLWEDEDGDAMDWCQNHLDDLWAQCGLKFKPAPEDKNPHKISLWFQVFRFKNIFVLWFFETTKYHHVQ